MNFRYKILVILVFLFTILDIYLKTSKEVSIEDIDRYFRVIRDTQNGKKKNELDNSLFFPKTDADNISVSFYYKNAFYGSSESSMLEFNKNNIIDELYRITLLTINDKRATNFEKKLDYSKLDTLISFLKKDGEITNIKNTFSKKYTRGIHSIQLINGKKSAYFLAYVPIYNHWNNTDILKKICLKAGMKSDCYKNSNSKIVLYKTTTYLKDKNSKIFEVNNYLNYQNKNLSRENILKLIENSVNWLRLNKKDFGFTYSYKILSKPISTTEIGSYIRQLASVRAYERTCVLIDELCLTNEKEFFDKVNNFYIENSIVTDNTIELKENGLYHPSLNALYILYLADSNIEDRNLLIEKLANHIIKSISEDGSIVGVDYSNDIALSIYSGEVYLSLINAYKVTRNVKYLDYFKKGIPFLNKISKEKKNTYIHWISQALYEYYLITNDHQIAKNILEINNYLIDEHQIVNDKNKFQIGSFSKKSPGCNTGFVLESLADAYNVAIQEKNQSSKEKIRDSIIVAVKNMSQSWINQSNSFYYTNNDLVIGSIMNCSNTNTTRVDFLGHALVALQKILQTDIY